MDQPLFSIKAYDYIYQKVQYKDSEMYFDGFYLPNTIVVQNSIITHWYFSSEFEPIVMKKQKQKLFPEQVINNLLVTNYPLNICFSVIYIDMVSNSQVSSKMEYLTAPQLYKLLMTMDNYDFTCVIQQMCFKTPNIKTINTNPMHILAERLKRAADDTAMQHKLKEKKLVNGEVYANTYTKPSIETSWYQLIKTDWTPKSLVCQGRRACCQLNLQFREPNERCASFFTDQKISESFALIESKQLFLNQALSRFALHISLLNNQKIVTRMICYFQLQETPLERQQKSSDIPVFIFAQLIEIEGKNVDEKFQNQIKFSMRKQFKSVQIMDFQIIKLVVSSLSQTGFVGSINPLIKRIFTSALDLASRGAYFIDEKLSIAKKIETLIKFLGSDFESTEKQFKNRASQFYNQLLFQVTMDEEFSQLAQLLNENERLKFKCSRCLKHVATDMFPLKLLLQEPLYYFKHSVPCIKQVFKECSLADCYALLYASIQQNATVLEFREQILDIFSKNASELDKHDGDEKFTMLNPQLVTLVEQHKESFPRRYQYIQQLKKLPNATKTHNLDLFKLAEYFDVNDSRIASIVPKKILVKAEIINEKVFMEPQAFIARCERDDFLQQHVYICPTCVGLAKLFIKQLVE